MLPRQMFLKPKAETRTNWLQHQEAAQVCEVEHQRGWARWRSTEPLPTEQKRLNQKTSDDTTNVLICRIGVRSISLVAHVNPPQALEQAKHATLEGGSPIEKMILAATESLTCHEQWSATYQANCKLLATPVCTILWLSVQTTLHNLAKAKKCPVARDFVKMGNFLRRVKSWDANLEESIIVGLRVHKTDCKDLQRSAKSPGCKKSKTANWEPGRMPLKVRSNKSWCASERRNRKRPRWSHIFFKIGLRVSFFVPTSNLKLNIKAHPSSQSQSPTSAMI